MSLGDLLDRGADSRKVMDLLMRLRARRRQGGQVHVLLGNHEAMNILGDLRYVEAGEYAAYGDLESPAERAELRQAWETANGADPAQPSTRSFRPGISAIARLFRPGPVRPMAAVAARSDLLNETLYMHAGPSNALRGMTLQELNLRYRTALTDHLELAARLEQAELLQAGDEYHDRPELAKDRLAAIAAAAAAQPDPALSDAASACRGRQPAPCSRRKVPTGTAEPRCATRRRKPTYCCLVATVRCHEARRRPHADAKSARSHPLRRPRHQARAGMNRAAYKGRAAALVLDGPEPRPLRRRNRRQPLEPEGLFVAPNELDDARSWRRCVTVRSR